LSDPEIRIDQLTGLRTIVAPSRSQRPFEVKVGERARVDPADCSFCEGHEDRTPDEYWADRPEGERDGPGWRVRSVPNLYPALVEDPEATAATAGQESGVSAATDPLRASARAGEPDLFSSTPATGAHEVIVHSPRHRTSLAELESEELAAAVAGWRERMRARAEESAYVQLIVNEGAGAGASIEHSHAQLYALGFVPVQVARERERFVSYNQRTMGGQLLSDIASEEVRRKERLVAIDDEALLVCPWASHGPFELRLIPRRPAPRFEEDDVGTEMLATAVRALAARFGGPPPLNLWVRTAPRGVELFQWRIDLSPRIGFRAAFELSTGVDIDPFGPEHAAAELREALDEGG
jgi:UDPglucose--hexose-1-phosphate uridylyltransferase